MVVFDVSNRASFDQIPKWFQELDTHMNSREEGSVVAFVVGNKIDRPGRLVTRQEGEAMAQRVGADGYYEASAKENVDVKQLFLKLTEKILVQQAKTIKFTSIQGIDISGSNEESSGCAC